MSEGLVFVGCPMHSNTLDSGTARSMFATGSRKRRLAVVPSQCSLLNLNCNMLWLNALNGREKEGIEWFAMLHADIEPDFYWIDTLIDLADKHKADIMSVLVPIKDERGLTSSGIVARDGNRLYCKQRFTMKQIWDKDFPSTFAANDKGVPPGELILNTGS